MDITIAVTPGKKSGTDNAKRQLGLEPPQLIGVNKTNLLRVLHLPVRVNPVHFLKDSWFHLMDEFQRRFIYGG